MFYYFDKKCIKHSNYLLCQLFGTLIDVGLEGHLLHLLGKHLELRPLDVVRAAVLPVLNVVQKLA